MNNFKIDDLSLLEKRFFDLYNLLLGKSNELDCKFANKKNSSNLNKNNLDKRINDYKKSINKYDLRVKDICSEFKINLESANYENFNYGIDEDNLNNQINIFINKLEYTAKKLTEDINELTKLKSKEAYEERIKSEKEEAERKRILEEQQKIKEAEQKKKDKSISITSILVGLAITLIIGIYFSIQDSFELSSGIIITYFIFSVVFGLGFSFWIYKDNLFRNTKLGYKNNIYIHSVGIPLIEVITICLSVSKLYGLMFFIQLGIVLLLLCYWYKNINKFSFMKKFTYKRIIVFIGIMSIICIFWSFIINVFIPLIVVLIVIFFVLSKK